MTGAALLLAAALWIAPSSSRGRLMPTAGGRRVPRLAWAVPVGLLAAVLLPVPVVAAAAIVTATVAVRRRQAAARRQADRDATRLEAALDVVVGELRAGAHPAAAVTAAAAEVDGAVRSALHTVAARARLGADVPAGLRAVAAGSTLRAQWLRLGLCWELAQTHGLALGALLRAAQRDIVERSRFNARVDAGMAGARATAAVLSGLPVVGVALGQLIGADPLTFLTGSRAGGWVLVVGASLTCCGLVWADRITRWVRL